MTDLSAAPAAPLLPWFVHMTDAYTYLSNTGCTMKAIDQKIIESRNRRPCVTRQRYIRTWLWEIDGTPAYQFHPTATDATISQSVYVVTAFGALQWCQSSFFLGGGEFFSLTGRGTKLGPRSEGPRAGGGLLGEGAASPHPHQLGSMGERCKLPQRSSWRSAGKFEIWCNLRPQYSLQKCLIMCKS